MVIRGASKKFLVIVILIWLLNTPLVYAAQIKGSEAYRGNVTIVVMDKVVLEDLLEAKIPNITQAMNTGAVGLMTTNPAGGAPRISPNTYTTIGSGAKVLAGYAGGMAFNADETVQENHRLAATEYTLRTGVVPSKSSVVHLGIAEIWNLNEKLKYGFVIGGLGTALHSAGLRTAVLGNSDTADFRFRQGAAIAMDNKGLVDFGDVSPRILINDSEAVYGKRTDYSLIEKLYWEVKSKAGLVVIDLGDTARLDMASVTLLPEVFEKQQRNILSRYDSFVGNILKSMDLEKDLLIILSPGPSSVAMEEPNYLTPVIMIGKGMQPGLLWSPTTKRTGLINNTDIAPTVLEFFGLPQYIPVEGQNVPVNGQPVQVTKGDKPVDTLLEMNKSIVHTFNVRYPLVKGFINLALVLIITSAIGLYFGLGFVKRIRFVLLALTSAPLAMLLHYFVPRTTVVGSVIAVIVIVVVLTGVAYIIGNHYKSKYLPFALIGICTAGVLILDLLTGGILNKTSPFSYDPMSGARFYGIGNEYMGVLIGAVLMGLGALPGEMTRLKKIFYLLVMALVTIVLIAPTLGTNVGGTIAALFGFATAAILMYRIRPKWNTLLPLLSGLGIIFAGFLFFDSSRSPESQSHIGRTVNLLMQGGIEEVTQIISRKWEVNWRLIRGTNWSWTYFSGLASIILFKHWFRDNLRTMIEGNPIFFNFLTAILVASLGALFFNDSGIVAAAIMIIFGAAPFFYFLVGQVKGNTPTKL